MATTVQHEGVVTRTGEGVVWVRITARSACGSCRIKEACGMAEAQDKLIEVHTTQAQRFAEGDAVQVGVKRRVGEFAVLLAYVGALVVLLALLGVTTGLLDWNEGVGALASLAGVGLYYVLLWLFRKEIEHKIQFTITKI